ncbi:MAG: hypothetical protein ACE1Y4_10910 [Lysobacterales bacterium]
MLPGIPAMQLLQSLCQFPSLSITDYSAIGHEYRRQQHAVLYQEKNAIVCFSLKVV